VTTGDTNGVRDVFVRDRDFDGNGVFDELGVGDMETVRISAADNGDEGNNASGSDRMSVSADGRYVAFHSQATTLVTPDANGALEDIFVVDRDADADAEFDEPGATKIVRVSVSSAGVQGTLGSNSPFISADGRFVVFDSDACNLIAGGPAGCTLTSKASISMPPWSYRLGITSDSNTCAVMSCARPLHSRPLSPLLATPFASTLTTVVTRVTRSCSSTS
jgi:hypothetical protein